MSDTGSSRHKSPPVTAMPVTRILNGKRLKRRAHVVSIADPKRRLALGVLCIAALLTSLDGFVLVLAVPAMTAALGATGAEQLWILDVYGFMVAGLTITMGNLGDLIGRRRLLLLAAGVFGAASLLAAYAVSPLVLIGARALLGVAGAAIVPCSLSLISTLSSNDRERAIALGVWGGCLTAGAMAGPVLGGVLLDHFWWGSTFLVGVPAAFVLLVAGRLLLPESRNEPTGRIDVASVLLSMAAILPAVYGVKHLASRGWNLASAATLVIGCIFGWIFVRRQPGLRDPLVNMGLFGRRPCVIVLGTMVSYSMLSAGVMVFVAQYFQLVRGMTPLAAGLALVPGMVISTTVFQLTPRLAQRIRPGVLISAGIGFTAAGSALMALATSTTVLMVAFAGTCIGAAPLQTLGSNVVIGSVPPQKAGSAAALIQTGIELGYALGIAIPGSVVTLTYRATMDGKGGSSLGEAIANAEPAEVLSTAREAFTTGFHLLAGGSAAALAVVSVLLIRALRELPALGNDRRLSDRRSAS
jgi:DHA2 family multidrug resistance protein-like MFS transporter